MKKPHWPLTRVKELAQKEKGLFLQRTRALDFFPTFEEAYQTAKEVLVTLQLSSFSHSVQLTWDFADVYGVMIKQVGWYLKITIDEQIPEVAVISFHPLERPLKTNRGIVEP